MENVLAVLTDHSSKRKVINWFENRSRRTKLEWKAKNSFVDGRGKKGRGKRAGEEGPFVVPRRPRRPSPSPAAPVELRSSQTREAAEIASSALHDERRLRGLRRKRVLRIVKPAVVRRLVRLVPSRLSSCQQAVAAVGVRPENSSASRRCRPDYCTWCTRGRGACRTAELAQSFCCCAVFKVQCVLFFFLVRWLYSSGRQAERPSGVPIPRSALRISFHTTIFVRRVKGISGIVVQMTRAILGRA